MALLAGAAATLGLAVGVVLPAEASGAEGPTLTMRAVPEPTVGSFATDPAIAPALDGQGEFYSLSGLNGANGLLYEASPSGSFSQLAASSYVSEYAYSVVSADGFDWILTNHGLMALSGGGTATNLQIQTDAGTDITVGPDGDLYIANPTADSITKCAITPAPSASCGTTLTVPASFAFPQPESIVSDDGRLWFTTSAGELGSVTTTGTFGGPYDESVSQFSDGPAGTAPNMLAAAPDGTLWSTSVAPDDDTQNQIVKIDPATGSVEARYGTAAGLPAGTNISGLTVGPDGNVWFVDSGGAGAAGVLDVADGKVTEFAFPGAYVSSALIPSGISAGPDGTVWFSATTQDNDPALGEISSLGSATASVGASATAADGRSAAFRLHCSGASGANCTGTAAFATTVTERTKTRSRGHTKTVSTVKTVSLGSVSYRAAAGTSPALNVALNAAAKRLLTAASHHTLSVVVTLTPQVGTPAGSKLTLRG